MFIALELTLYMTGKLIVLAILTIFWTHGRFSQLLNIQGVRDIKLNKVHTSEQLVPEPGLHEDEIATENLKRYKSSDTDQFQAELVQQGREMLT